MNDKLNEALNEIRDEYIDEAAKAKKRRPYWFGAVAAILAAAILMAIFWDPRANLPTVQGTQPETLPSLTPPVVPGELHLANLVAAPNYPQMTAKPDYGDYADKTDYYNTLRTWQKEINTFYDQPEGYANSLTNYFSASIREFLSGDENQAYSPLNVYLAMAMLAETTGGESRQQILDLFGVATIEELRTQSGHVWNAHYCSDGETTSLLANSVWLDQEYSFHQDTLDTLADSYYASAFHGDLGTEEMNQQLRAWLDAQTGGLLKEQLENLELDPRTVFALASTVYFTAGWEEKFSESKTANALFHCSDKELVTPFMNRSFTGTYYWAENFAAVELYLTGNNSMWLILPDEGYRVSDILKSDDYLQLTLNPSAWENRKYLIIHLSLPKFDISSDMDLIQGMKNLGVTDIFDPVTADFTPMTDTPELHVNKIDHAARVKIDEEGVEAAAYTVISLKDNGAPPEDEVDFVLDRPFLFIVSSRDNLPLFAGVVNEP